MTKQEAFEKWFKETFSDVPITSRDFVEAAKPGLRDAFFAGWDACDKFITEQL